MADGAQTPTTPPEQSIVDAKAEHDIDAELRAGAERARQIRESRDRSSPAPLAGQVLTRFLELRQSIKRSTDAPPDRALRIAPEEGDAPTVPEPFRRGMV